MDPCRAWQRNRPFRDGHPSRGLLPRPHHCSGALRSCSPPSESAAPLPALVYVGSHIAINRDGDSTYPVAKRPAASMSSSTKLRMYRMRCSPPNLASSLICLFLAVACSNDTTRIREAGWRAEWNARADTASTLWENPCGDPEFDAWADTFLSACQSDERLGQDECTHRRSWVAARSKQCAEWQDYLLRNHGKHRRRDDAREPPTRVE